MADGVQNGSDVLGTGRLVAAEVLAGTMAVRVSGNGVRYCSFGDTGLEPKDLERVIGAVPVTVSRALGARAFYFVPLAMAERQGAERQGAEKREVMVAPVYTVELADEAILPPECGPAGTGGRAGA